jgi:HD superfamily phosphohydrolase
LGAEPGVENSCLRVESVTLIIHDPIYGRFETPRFLDRLILVPEVRRLMDVRLLNAPSPSLPTLSEIRRFSHTLGVLHLALTNPHVGLRKEELRALTAAILVHDAATPPFAHLLEYYLKDRAGWTHEAALPEMLTGHHVLENVAHQILPGEDLKFKRICALCGIDFEIVLQIVRKQHRASSLLFGTLDFDNLDNVLRMAWALGLGVEHAPFLRIASELAVSFDGELVLSIELKRAVETWAAARRTIYEILVFDELTVGSQAVLTKAVRLLFDSKQVPDIKWSYRDRDLLDLLARSRETKNLMLRHFSESLPCQLLALQISGSLQELGFSSRGHAIDFVERIASDEFRIRQPFGYVFVDNGIFAKALEFIDPTTRSRWMSGQSSKSVVIYCFAHVTGKSVARIRKAFPHLVLQSLGKAAGSNVNDARASTRLTS